MQAWAEFKLQKTKGARIQHALDASHAKTVEESQHYIRAMIDALLYTACQNKAQRGHREGSQSDNRGNFLELLDMISRYDEIVKNKLSGPDNAKYMHHDIKSELLDIIAGMIRKNISKEVMETEHFALIVDETKDAAAEFFVTIQKLYKLFSTSVVHEEFLKLSDHLQSPDLQLAFKEDLVQSVISGLSEMRIEAALKDLKESAEDICKKLGICTETMHQGGQ
ncbi:zinc finger MYM-type protein 1-like [Tachypleus tridentatus]|uniref:zinc finger MYM-type protein 1-like n=1 Tax=Tachypleus tridentatus TaxID=6853 RepID=UPI003FD49AF1